MNAVVVSMEYAVSTELRAKPKEKARAKEKNPQMMQDITRTTRMDANKYSQKKIRYCIRICKKGRVVCDGDSFTGR